VKNTLLHRARNSTRHIQRVSLKKNMGLILFSMSLLKVQQMLTPEGSLNLDLISGMMKDVKEEPISFSEIFKG
jgi:hypothetical protein